MIKQEVTFCPRPPASSYSLICVAADMNKMPITAFKTDITLVACRMQSYEDRGSNELGHTLLGNKTRRTIVRFPVELGQEEIIDKRMFWAALRFSNQHACSSDTCHL